MISVVVPTIAGREHHLERCLESYLSCSQYELELVVISDRQTCGRAWQDGADQARGDHLHFTADDLVPRQGWDTIAVSTVDAGCLPAAVIYDADGEFESCAGTTRLYPDGVVAPMYNAVPFFSAEQWQAIGPMGPMTEAHYYTDNYLSWRAWKIGIPVIVRHAYAFDHYWAQVGRGAGMTDVQRMDHDRELYVRAIRG